MIQLLINKQAVDLRPSTTITITEKRDLFNLAILGGSVSIPFDIAPSDKNRKILGFIDDPTSTTIFEQEYDASLYFCDSIALEGKFVLRKASKKRQLNGYFKTDSGALSEFADTNIRELITETFLVSDRLDVTTINGNTSNNILFPRHTQIFLNPNGEGASGEVEFGGLYNPTPNAPAIFGFERYRACPKVRYIIDLVFESFGYSTSYNFSDNTFDQLVWIPSNQESVTIYNPNPGFGLPPTGFPHLWQVSDIVPNITFSQLLSSIRANFNLKVSIDASLKVATFENMADIIQTSSSDFSEYLQGEVEIERVPDNNFSTNEISFEVDNPNEITDLTQLPDVVSYSDALPIVADLDKIVIATFDSQYYQVVELRDPSTSSIGYDYVPFTTNLVPRNILGLTTDVASQLSVIPNEEYQFRNSTDISIRDNGSGKVRLLIQGDVVLGIDPTNQTQIRLIGDHPYNKQFVDVTAVGGTFADLDLNYISDQTLDIQARIATVFSSPVLSTGYQDGPEGGVSIYHQITDTTDLSETYAYASSSVLDTDKITVLSNSALIFDTPEGIYAHYYEAIVNLLGTANKKASFNLWLPIAQILNRKSNFIVANGVKYLVSQFKFKMRNAYKERLPCEIESRIS